MQLNVLINPSWQYYDRNWRAAAETTFGVGSLKVTDAISKTPK